MIQIVRLVEALPEGFARLRAEAQAAGRGHLDGFVRDWADGPARLLDGEAVMAAFLDGELAGIGALVQEPAEAGAFRIRRFYVGEAFRGRGVGRTLASALMQQGLAHSPSLTVHAARAEARAFWEAVGFRLDERQGWSHRYGP